jgi:hypothetical protein
MDMQTPWASSPKQHGNCGNAMQYQIFAWGMAQKKESSSFLKKRTKKLL